LESCDGERRRLTSSQCQRYVLFKQNYNGRAFRINSTGNPQSGSRNRSVRRLQGGGGQTFGSNQGRVDRATVQQESPRKGGRNSDNGPIIQSTLSSQPLTGTAEKKEGTRLIGPFAIPFKNSRRRSRMRINVSCTAIPPQRFGYRSTRDARVVEGEGRRLQRACPRLVEMRNLKPTDIRNVNKG